MNLLSYLLSFCECPDKTKDPFEFEYDPDTVEVLRQIYNETNKLEFDFSSDSEDSDYEPEESSGEEGEFSSSDDDDEPEELIVKKHIRSGLFYLF
tara:strand:+ start:5228 stop:5512 length:285 start_codon:yes stop_codon:yes gene_type:complete